MNVSMYASSVRVSSARESRSSGRREPMVSSCSGRHSAAGRNVQRPPLSDGISVAKASFLFRLEADSARLRDLCHHSHTRPGQLAKLGAEAEELAGQAEDSGM